jgi:hypothetical protein
MSQYLHIWLLDIFMLFLCLVLSQHLLRLCWYFIRLIHLLLGFLLIIYTTLFIFTIDVLG